MKTLRILSASLAGFLAAAGAWYVNHWDYESAYSRGLLDGARVGFAKGHQNALEELADRAQVPRLASEAGNGPA